MFYNNTNNIFNVLYIYITFDFSITSMIFIVYNHMVGSSWRGC